MKTSMVIRCGVVGLSDPPFSARCWILQRDRSRRSNGVSSRVGREATGSRSMSDLLAGAANDLRDLRFVSAAGEEIPYLLLDQPRADRKWKDGRILPLRRTKSSSGFEVDLGELIRIDRIRIEGLPAPFLKRVRLEAGGDRTRWTLLHEQATLFDLPGRRSAAARTRFRTGRVSLPPGRVERSLEWPVAAAGAGRCSFARGQPATASSQGTAGL